MSSFDYSCPVELPRFDQPTRTQDAFNTLETFGVDASVPDPVSSVQSSYDTSTELVVPGDISASVSRFVLER